MALIKCQKCGNEISDKAEICPNCDCPVKKAKVKKIDPVNNRKKHIIGAIAFGIALVSGIGIYFGTSNLRSYSQALNDYKKGSYEKAMHEFSKLKDYKDSQNMYNESKHMFEVSNDEDIPKLIISENELSFYTGETFNLDEWARNNISVTDNVTKSIDYSITDCDIDMNKSGKYVVKISAMDEAGNETIENITITISEKPSKVYEAYIEATNLLVDSLAKNSIGSYSYNGIGIISNETDWLDTEWGKSAEYLNQGAIYRSLAKKIDGFYLFGKTLYGNWKGIIPTIFDIDDPGSWDDMKPYVDKVFPYIKTNDYFKPMMDRFSKLESFEGTIDTINGIYDFRINDVEEAASELGITQEMFGYMLAALDEYAPNVNFEGKVYQFSLDLDIPVKDISYDDYTAYINETESYENSMYKRLKDEYSNEGGVDYFFYIEGVDPYKEGVITTARGIQIGSSKNLVISLYGEPEKEISNKKDNYFKTGLKNTQTEEYYNYYIESCDRLLVYNYEDKGHIIFWIDKNDEVSGVAYTDFIFL